MRNCKGRNLNLDIIRFVIYAVTSNQISSSIYNLIPEAKHSNLNSTIKQARHDSAELIKGVLADFLCVGKTC